MSIPSHLRCKQFVEVVTDYLEHALPVEQVELIEQHLIICDPCVEYVAQMREVLARSRSLREAGHEPRPVDGPTTQKLLEAFRKRKEKAGP